MYHVQCSTAVLIKGPTEEGTLDGKPSDEALLLLPLSLFNIGTLKENLVIAHVCVYYSRIFRVTLKLSTLCYL